jgi:HK97 family phage major capsid protein
VNRYLQMLRDRRTELEARRDELVQRMTAVTDAAADEQRTELNEAEDAEFSEARTALGELDTELDTIEARMREVEATERQRTDSTDAPLRQRRVEVGAPSEVRSLNRAEARDGALALLEERADEMGLSDGNVERLERMFRSSRTANTDGDQLARRMLLTENEHYRSAWQKLVTQAQPVLNPDEARAVEAYIEHRTMVIGTDASGGFGVPFTIDPTIIQTEAASTNVIEELARVVQVTTNKWRGVSAGSVEWSFDDELEEVSDDSPTLARPEITVHTARGFVPFSIEVGQDYPGFAADMAVLLRDGYEDLKAQKFAVGTGTGEPWGLFTRLIATAGSQVQVGTPDGFAGADVAAALDALPERYAEAATWLMSRSTSSLIAAFGNGNNLSFATVDLTGRLRTLLDRPVRTTAYAPATDLETSGSPIAVVGDFRNYVIAQRAGMDVELVPHLFGANRRPIGARGWFAHARVGADVVNTDAFRLLEAVAGA